MLSNIIIAGITFYFGKPITDRLGKTGTKTISKVASLLLASIAIMLIRRGVFEAVRNAGF